MLDTDTRRRIDTARDILVGKIPDPKAQVEQITIALIYKFMDDMDAESEELGGKRKFFTGDFARYGWTKLTRPGLGGQETLGLYMEAIAKIPENPAIPLLFRDIFKNAFLPYRDPETLKSFLKIIDEFTYDHSERLGDAFEYLLSVLGSQGDAGQFRTPRHVIDFMVAILDPKKNETILDPACGTAGFLISSYKHILKANADDKGQSKLTPDEKGKLAGNFKGYDISPDMVRLSLVNLYLHGFIDPRIEEYDTLTSEDKWNELADVILANPPFMSPKGGIKPHKRFSVQSRRSEVLFVDYIMEHLKHNGRAGIVVPEGIIFQTGTAYKALRKKLIEECLVGVISLPAGVFQPYSGVKTSILILDKELNQKTDSIFFAKVENDGFSLGAQRTPISKNDIPQTIEQINKFFGGNENTLVSASKKQISEKDCKLTIGNYETSTQILSVFDVVTLKEVVTGKPIYGSGAKKSVFDGGVRYLRITDITDDGRLKSHDLVSPSEVESEYFLSPDDFLIARSGSVGRSYLHGEVSLPCQFAGYLIKFPLVRNKIIPKFLFYITKSQEYWNWINRHKKDGTISNINAKEYLELAFPLPPIEVQREIVEELEGYQKIIDGCRQVVENYKPTIDIDPSWEMVEFDKVFKENLDSKRVPVTGSDRKAGNIPYYGASGIVDYVEGYLFNDDLLLISEDGANLKDRNYPIAFSVTGKTWVNNHAHVLKFDNFLTQKYIEFYFNQISVEPYLTGSAQPKLNQGTLNKIRIPFPSSDVIRTIVETLIKEKDAVDGNATLIEVYTQKIQDRISKVWGEEPK